MRSTFKVLFYVKKGSEKPNGNLPLMCRITVDGEIKVSIRPTTGIKPLYTTIATVTMNLIVSAAIVLL